MDETTGMNNPIFRIATNMQQSGMNQMNNNLNQINPNSNFRLIRRGAPCGLPFKFAEQLQF